MLVPLPNGSWIESSQNISITVAQNSGDGSYIVTVMVYRSVTNQDLMEGHYINVYSSDQDVAYKVAADIAKTVNKARLAEKVGVGGLVARRVEKTGCEIIKPIKEPSFKVGGLVAIRDDRDKNNNYVYRNGVISRITVDAEGLIEYYVNVDDVGIKKFTETELWNQMER